MRRFLIGSILLAILLGIGITVSCLFCLVHEPIAELLEEARDAAMSKNWEEAEDTLTHARQRWERCRHFTAAFADHAPMDEIDAAFAQLEVYARQRDLSHFPALCAHLAQLAEAMVDSHRLCWWTLL